MKKGELVVWLRGGKRVPCVIIGFGPFGYVAIRTIDNERWDTQLHHLSASTRDERRRFLQANSGYEGLASQIEDANLSGTIA